MDKVVSWYQNLSTGSKLIVYILGSILLGCIGSGLWAKLIDPLIVSFWRIILSFCSKYFMGYMDGFFSRAAYGDYHSGVSQFLFFISALIYLFSMFMDQLFVEVDKKKERIKAIKLPIMIIAFLMMFWSLRYRLSSDIAKGAITSLEIVRPYVQEQQYYKLKSEFHSINSQKDYKSFYDKMKAIDDKNSEISLKLKRVD